MHASDDAGFPPATSRELAPSKKSATLAPEDLAIWELHPRPPDAPPILARIVGPGRRERDYLKRLAHFEGLLTLERERQRGLEQVLELSQRVERGAQRRLDRLEQRIEASQQRERRLSALLGAVQRENELLRGRVAKLDALRPLALESGVPRPGFWRRLFGREPRD